MRLLHVITFMIVIFGFYSEGEGRESSYKNYNIIVPDVRSCPKLCENGLYSTIMVQTAVSNLTNINTEISNHTAIINYKCKSIVIEGSLEAMQQNLYQKMCQDRLEFCKENKTGFESNWQSINKDEPQVMKVDIRLPSNAMELRIKINKCVELFVMYLFMINGENINYNANPDYKFNSEVFSTINLTTSPLQLKIKPLPNGTIVDIMFNIAKSKCSYGWHEDSDNKMGFKCFVNIRNMKVEGGYLSLQCQSIDKQTTDLNQMKYTCGNGEVNVCRDRCYNMPNCSYMCAVGTDDRLIEDGYIMNVTDGKYPDVIGSGRWKANELPVKLVLFNECSFDAGVCELGDIYCKDEDVSFSCTNGSYNLKNCLAAMVKYPYWRCPADETAISMVIRTPGLLRNQKDSIFYKNEIMKQYVNKTDSIKTIQMFYEIIKDLSSNKTNDSFNLPVKEKRNFASFLLKNFVDNYCAYSRKNSKEVFEDDSFYYSAVDIDEDKEEIDIVMESDPAENNTQFIKLEINKSDSPNNQKVRANYFQFKNIDLMDEGDAVKTNLENMKTIKDSKISPPDYDNDEEVFYKNSKMFTLTVEGANVVKAIKFKLNMIEEIESHSWLYQVENVCGFLDENRNWTWSTVGCMLVKKGSDSYCQCNHLSNFAMLFAMREVNKGHLRAFEILSVLGGVINIVSLFLFLIFVLFINSREKLRIDQLNIAICIMVGTIIFLSGSLFSKNHILCSVAALSTQFLIVAAFVWKLILGINVVRLIASLRYQNEDWLVKYRWIMLVAGYSVPLVIVAISGGMYWQSYGMISDNVCWIDASSKAFLSFLIPIGIIMAVNTIGLFFIANTLIRNYINTHKTRMNDSNELIVFVQLLVSMGLTWLPAYFAIVYLSAMYLFVIFFPLQGLLMFLLVVVINKENREKVSSFIINNYNSITSKSTSGTDGHTNSRSKSSGQSKGTESDNLLTGIDKSHDSREKSEDRLVAAVLVDTERGDIVTKC